MRMPHIVQALTPGVLSFLTGCVTVSVQTRHDPSADFTGYTTYVWIPAPEVPVGRDDPVLTQTVREVVDAQLAAQGFERAEGRRADFMVFYEVTAEDRTAWETAASADAAPAAGWGFDNDDGWRWQDPASYTYEYMRGTLLLGVVDGDSKRLVWRGTAQADVYPADSRDRNRKKLEEAAGKMLSRFPPR